MGRKNDCDKQTRKSNIELLRIITMVMIVAHHFSVHGGFDFPTETVTINRLWIQFIGIGGKIGVDIFVLISGYFLVDSSRLKIDKLIKLWIQMITYSALIFIVFTGLKFKLFSIRSFVAHFLPVTSSYWWFASTYFVLYLLSPYINIFLHALDKKKYQGFLALLTFCWCIIPTFLVTSWQCNNLLWFIYTLQQDILKSTHPKVRQGGVYAAMSAGLIALTFLSAVILDFIGSIIPVCATHATFFYDMKRLPILLISVLMFVGFYK